MDLWNLTSPDKQLIIAVKQKKSGLCYVVKKNDRFVFGESALGLSSSSGNFFKGLVFQSVLEREVVDQYALLGAKKSHVIAQGNELVLTFKKKKALFQLILRAYNDGFAFCYSIQTKDGLPVSIIEETSEFRIPEQATVFAMPYRPNHETTAGTLQSPNLKGEYCLPALLHTKQDDVWALISEATLSAEYCGASLKGDGEGVLTLGFSPEQKRDVQSSSPFFTPWRFAVIGSTADIAENTMAETLSPACALADTDWICPGVTAWSWLNRDKTDDLETYLRYVDLCVEMGWQYLLLDAGWQPEAKNQKKERYSGYFDWTQELIDYATERNIRLIVWVHHQDVNTPEKQKRLLEWKQMGFAGVKVDFFDSQTQETMALYDRLMRLTAELHLVLNPHGANKAAGERRTWPHVLTREGIFGQEQELSSDEARLLTAQHNCMLPFTRLAVGPADYTPMLSYRNSKSTKPFTLAHMAALPIVFESGIQCLADKPEVYEKSPAKPLLQFLPVSWDETRLIEGVPGDYVTLARRVGKTWFVGAICNKARDAEIPLHFLDEGSYLAQVYRDGKTRDIINAQEVEVTRETVLIVPMLKTGGMGIRLLKTK